MTIFAPNSQTDIQSTLIFITSSIHTKKLGGVMNREDMDLVADKPIDNSVGAVNHFSNSGIVDLRNDTPGLWESR